MVRPERGPYREMRTKWVARDLRENLSLRGEISEKKRWMRPFMGIGASYYRHRSAGLRPGKIRVACQHAGSETGAPAVMSRCARWEWQRLSRPRRRPRNRSFLPRRCKNDYDYEDDDEDDSRLLLQANQPFTNGVAHQTGHVMNVEPVHQLRAVRFDGFDAHTEQSGDFLGVFSFGNEL